MAETPPSVLARETLKLLAARRMAPTPENFQTLYHEVSGQAPATAAAFPQTQLAQIHSVLPGQTAAQKRLLEQFKSAVAAQSWAMLQNTLVGYANLGLKTVEAAAANAGPEARAQSLPATLAEQIARLVENTLPALGEDDIRILQMARELAQHLRQPQVSATALEPLLNNFAYRLSFATEDQAGVRAALAQLLQLVFENIALLSPDDQWMQGQAQALQQASTPPLSLRRLNEVQQRLKDVIGKQAEARGRELQAQAQMKELLALFIDRLSKMDASSSAHHAQLEQCAARIGRATQLHEITPLLEEVMSAVRAMALQSKVAAGELHDLRERTDATHVQIVQLRQALEDASTQARHDPLTGTLNRKGMEEALSREVARARRNDAPLCVALLDLDNFKALNDRLGHATGDAALKHLVDTTRTVMRPQDQLARYGGEEFVIVMPDTQVADAVQAMQRLQRELTTRYFLANRERVLITFSAGVAQMQAHEDSSGALERADRAMHLAKQSGKNRVLAA